MSNVVCLVNVEADRATFTWSEGPASFHPYKLEGQKFLDFQNTAQTARQRLNNLVIDYLHYQHKVPHSAFELAETGYELYKAIFIPGADQLSLAKPVRKWLENLREQGAVDSIEIVVEKPWKMPWNVVYDRRPVEQEFLEGTDQVDHWKPFWGLRYNLAGGRKVDPLRRMPLMTDPAVVLVLDRKVLRGLPPEQQNGLIAFGESSRVQVVHTKDELIAAVRPDRPELLYWLSHATPKYLELGDDRIKPSELADILSKDDFDEPYELGGLAFLNACQTAEAGENGSFLDALHDVGFSGIVATEQQTIDTFAAPLGIDFLQSFLKGEPVGKILHELRGRVPLGLLYGTYCPPEIRVQRPSDDVSAEKIHPIAFVPGIAMRAGLAADETASRTLPPLPDEPYRSLAYYDREDRALFAGRDDDTERFARMLDDASTRILVLHGESGVGKSSFLRAGVIPYLEEECLGYRFVRERLEDESGAAQGSVIFIRATNDLFGQLAQALCEFCARPYEYHTPLGEQVSADLPGVLRELVADEVSPAVVRAVLRSDPSLLGRIMAAISNCLPFTAILVIDQGEEVFTLAQTPEDQQRGRQALDMLRRTVGAPGDFKVIFALRTEYYGRVIDRMRRGLHDMGLIREYLLTDFDEQSLIEAIRRPTADAAIPYTSEVPLEKYGFRYADGVAEEIAHRAVRYTTQRRDSVLLLVQVICAQLYRLASQRADKTITLSDLETLGGIEGGMRNHVEGLLGELVQGRPLEKKPVQKLFTQLYLKQPDGTLTTALLAEDEVQQRWTGRMPFAKLLEPCRQLRLLKVNTLRIGMEEERRYVSLGHDALAKIAAEWDEQLSRGGRFRRMAVASLAVVAVVVLIAGFAIHAANSAREAANNAAALATKEREAAGIAAEFAEKQTKAAVEKAKASWRAAEAAKENERNTKKLLDQTRAAQKEMRRARYADQLKLALKHREKHPVRLERALESMAPPDSGLRGFEWYYLKHSLSQSKRSIPTPNERFYQIAWMPEPGAFLLVDQDGLSYALASDSSYPAADDWKPLGEASETLTTAINAPICAVVSEKSIRVFELSENGARALTTIDIPPDMVEESNYYSPSYRHHLAISPDGKKLALASRIFLSKGFETHIAVFESGHKSMVARTGVPLVQGEIRRSDKQKITSIAFTPDGELAVVTRNPCDFWILKKDGAELKPRPKLSLDYTRAVLSPNGDKVALTLRLGKYWVALVELSDLATGNNPDDVVIELERPDEVPDSPILDFGFAVDGKHVVVLAESSLRGRSGFQAVWYELAGNTERVAVSGELVGAMYNFDESRRSTSRWCAAGPEADGPRLLWAGDEGACRALLPDPQDPSEGLVKSPSEKNTWASYLEMSPSGDRIDVETVHNSEDGKFAVPRVINPLRLEQREPGTPEGWLAIGAGRCRVSDDGQYVAGTDKDHTDPHNHSLRMFCVKIDGDNLRPIPLGDLADADLTVFLRFRPKHSQLYLSRDKWLFEIERWDLTAEGLTLGTSFRSAGGEQLFGRLVYTADRIFMSTTTAIYEWNADTGEQIHPKPASAKSHTSEQIRRDPTGWKSDYLRMLGDDRHLATMVGPPPTFETHLVIWDTTNWTEACRRKLPRDVSPKRCAIHPSGTRLVSWTPGNRITFWDVGPWAGEKIEIQELISIDLQDEVDHLDFTSDGQTLAGLQGDDVRIWRAPGTARWSAKASPN